MDNMTKNLWDVILNIVTLVAAAVAFGFGLYQWRRSQAWQRAEKFDKLVEKFETDELLRLATVIIDWSERKVRFRNRDLTVLNDEALLALRDHQAIEVLPKFPGEQATLRDAYDALLAFFNRLDVAISTGLIDAKPARDYFGYWLERLLKFDRHPDVDNVLGGKTPKAMVAGYIKVYADPKSIDSLRKHFGMADVN